MYDYINIWASGWLGNFASQAKPFLNGDWASTSLIFVFVLVSAFPRRFFSDEKPKSQSASVLTPDSQLLEAEIHSLKIECQSLKKDVTDLEQALFVSAVRFKTFINNMPSPAFTLNEVGHIIEWNGESEKLFGLKAHQVIDQPLMSIIGVDAFRFIADKALYMVYLGNQVQPVKCRLKTRRQESKDTVWYITPILDIERKVQGAVVNIITCVCD